MKKNCEQIKNTSGSISTPEAPELRTAAAVSSESRFLSIGRAYPRSSIYRLINE